MKPYPQTQETRRACWGGLLQCAASGLIGLLAGLMLSGAVMLLGK